MYEMIQCYLQLCLYAAFREKLVNLFWVTDMQV